MSLNHNVFGPAPWLLLFACLLTRPPACAHAEMTKGRDGRPFVRPFGLSTWRRIIEMETSLFMCHACDVSAALSLTADPRAVANDRPRPAASRPAMAHIAQHNTDAAPYPEFQELTCVFFCASIDGTGPRSKSLWLAAKGSVSSRSGVQPLAQQGVPKLGNVDHRVGVFEVGKQKETTPTLLSRSHCGSSKRRMSQPPGPGFKKRGCGDCCSAGSASLRARQ